MSDPIDTAQQYRRERRTAAYATAGNITLAIIYGIIFALVLAGYGILN